MKAAGSTSRKTPVGHVRHRVNRDVSRVTEAPARLVEFDHP